jgi:adenine phosphoribosyltransferase
VDIRDNLLAESYSDLDLVRLPNGYNFMMAPLSEHYPATESALLRETVAKLASMEVLHGVDKIVAEFDRCAHILGAACLHLNRPIAGAKWFPGPKENISSQLKMEYYEGDIFPYGINPGDRVGLIDDTVSSGGTFRSLIDLCQTLNANIIGAVTVVEKEEYKGIKMVQENTGIKVQRMIGVSVTGKKTEVVSDIFKNS